MCGIFGYIGKRDNSADLVLRGLKKLEYRGYDSWGIASLKSKTKDQKVRKYIKKEESQIVVKKKAGKIGQATTKGMPKSPFSLGHTRWATHGGVTDINAHPHLDCQKNIAIIHNGIVENYDLIKKELLKLGHKLKSETDTEVAVHLIEENYKQIRIANSKYKAGDKRGKTDEEMFLEAVRVSFNRFTGLNAIIAMDARSNVFVAAKSGSPLVAGKGKKENFLSSDAHALMSYTNKVYFMQDEELVLVSKDKINVYNAKNGKKKTVKFTTLNLKKQKSVKGSFQHFMLKEIYDQPKVINDILNSSSNQINKFSNLIKSSFGAYLVGCGSAAYACLSGTYIFSKIAKRHINFSVGSEFGYLVDFLTDKSLIIALSQSGETIDVIEAVKKAKEKKAKISSLVNVLGSTLYRMSDQKLLLNAGVEKAVVSTKAFTAKLAYLLLLAHELAGKNKEGKRQLKNSITALSDVLSNNSIQRIKKLTKLLLHKKHIYIIGRGLSYPIALETALKIKEASYIHAEGFAAGELKHGVIALIEKQTPCIAFLPNDETYGASLAGSMEMKARGGFIIGVSHKNHEIFDYYLPISDIGEASIIPSVVTGQLLGYFLAVGKGLDPDKPRNLAKSVTVK